MTQTRLLVLGALLGWPLLTLGQAPAPRPRLYVGVGGAEVTYWREPRRNKFFTSTLVGPALTAGGHLSRRLSLEVGAAYAWPGRSRSGLTIGGQATASTVRLHQLTLPLLLRCDLLPAARRWHAEAVGGLTVRAARESYVYHGFAGSSPFTSESVDYAAGLGLTLGPALRYALAPRLALTAETLLSAELTRYDFNDLSLDQAPIYTLGDRLFWQLRAGARYAFGR